MNDFRAFLESIGLRPQTIIADGLRHRCRTVDKPKKKNGEYRVYSSGRAGYGINYATMSDWAEWRTDTGVSELPAFDPKVLADARAKARHELLAAIRSARAFYGMCAPLIGGHEYLRSHDLDMTGCYGLRVDRDGWLVIPALDRTGQVMTVQRISPTGEKLFWKGAPVRASRYIVDRTHASVTVLCEGLATGLAIFAAVPTSRVVVAFNSGNLLHVATQLSGSLTVIAADNDWETEARLGGNPGIDAATAAADAIGCGVAVPRGIEGTDWCDFRREMVEGRLDKQLPNERASDIRRAVDASIAREIIRNARFIAAPQRA